MNNREVLAINLKALMKHYDIKSQVKLSKVTGVSQTQIGYILRGEKAASIDILERLANSLNCEPWLLLAPVNLIVDYGQPDFTPLVYCYSRLRQQDQNAVWDMTHNLYE
ncbi:MAG: helix-turn-helix transcriptional regulator, partial [Lysobacterales bacterium]